MIIKELGTSKNKKGNQQAYTNKNAVKKTVGYIEDKAQKQDIQNMVDYATDKSKKAWYINLPNDAELAIKKMEATQKINGRATASKLYHYMFSFRQEDTKPSDKSILDMEQKISEKLGYKEHQRVIAIHNDTANYHVHVVINKVHPTTHNNITPYYSQYAMNDIAKELEQQYSLEKDNRINFAERSNKNHKAIDFEAHTGLESFTTYLKKEIKENVLNTNTWQELHQVSKKVGVIVKLQGNGLVFKSINSKVTVKASTVDRKLSKSSLEQKLGKFTEFKQQKIDKIDLEAQYNMNNNVEILNITPHKNNANLGILEQEKNYNPKPTHKNSNILWNKYQSIEKDKKNQQEIQLQEAKNKYIQELSKIKQTKLEQKQFLKTSDIKYQDKINLSLNIELKYKQEFENTYDNYKKEKAKIYKVTKKQNWLAYLMQEAKTNPNTLEVLQSNLNNQDKNHKGKIQGMSFLNDKNKYVGYGHISKNGEIHYKTIDSGQFKVSKQGIYILQDSKQARQQALEVAYKSYGDKLKVQGSQEFTQEIEKYAKQKSISINQKNSDLER